MLDVQHIDPWNPPTAIDARWPDGQLELKTSRKKLTARFCLATDIDMMDCR